MYRKLLIPVVLMASLAACDDSGEEFSVCPTGSSPSSPDTLVGATVDGRSVIANEVNSHVVAGFPPGSLYFSLFGTATEDGREQVIDLRIYQFRGMGSYPVKEVSESAYAWSAFSCAFPAGDLVPAVERESFFPLTSGLTGDSVWVTSWDSVSRRITGTFAYHLSSPAGAVIPVTDGTFDLVLPE